MTRVMRAIAHYFELHLQNGLGSLGRLARQPFATALTLLVIAIALALPAGLRVMIENAGTLSSSFERAADFTVYLKTDVSPDRAKAFAAKLQARPDIGAVDLIDRDAALAEFRRQSGFGDALDALEGNPLPDTLVVRPKTGLEADVAAIARDIERLPETDVVQVDTQWVERLRAALRLAERFVDLATGLLALAVAVVIGNTIRLEINNRSVEIEVTKLVGGTDAFIRRPFLYLGAWYGLGGAVIAELVLLAAKLAMEAPVRKLSTLYGSSFELRTLDLREHLVLVAGGAVLGWLGALLATARHLRAIEPK
jgi:cell division transport system permease protein